MKWTAVALIAAVALSACTERASQAGGGCPVTLDSTYTLDTREHGDTTYHLVLRVAGWHDKTEVLQLFDQQPLFDQCNRNTINPIFDDSLDPNLAVEALLIDPVNDTYSIRYSDGKPGSFSAKDIRIEFAD